MGDRRAREALRPTFVSPLSDAYARPGGPWDRGPLDSSFPPAARSAVIDDDQRLEASQVESCIAAMAGALRAVGIRKGDVVSWQLPNCAAAVLMYRASWRIGAVAAPLHHRLGETEVRAALAQVDPSLVVATAAMPAADEPGSLVTDDPSPGVLIEMLPSAPPVEAGSQNEVAGSDIAVVLFTSGSTGVPKAVMHTHRGLGYKGQLMVGVHGLLPSDAVLMPAPLAHVSGLLNGVLLPASAGIPSVLMSSWDPGRALELIERERVSFMGAPPVFFSQMASSERFGPARVSSMRLISTGGAAVSPSFVEATAEAFGCRVKRTYGSTEAPTVTTSGPRDDSEKARDTDGRPCGDVEIEIHDPSDGGVVATGQPGEIWIRGPELFAGYVDAGLTAMVHSAEGWYRSGDMGKLDAERWLTVTGRLSDVVIRAGENISTSEVEAVLEAHPSVRHAVAVGVPDEQLGERLAVFVESTGPFGLGQCREWFSERGMTKFKTPEAVFVLEQIPVLAAGKPDRAQLKKMARDRRPSESP